MGYLIFLEQNFLNEYFGNWTQRLSDSYDSLEKLKVSKDNRGFDRLPAQHIFVVHYELKWK